VHIELDVVRAFIVSPQADPQLPGAEQSRRYEAAVKACCALARAYLDSGFDVALDDVLPPDVFERLWRPQLSGVRWQIVIVLPALHETLRRSRARSKRVRGEITIQQHDAVSAWPAEAQLDTTKLSVDESLTSARRQGLLP
jgi:chloramphenicol 3-O-phosphotransferase